MGSEFQAAKLKTFGKEFVTLFRKKVTKFIRYSGQVTFKSLDEKTNLFQAEVACPLFSSLNNYGGRFSARVFFQSHRKSFIP